MVGTRHSAILILSLHKPFAGSTKQQEEQEQSPRTNDDMPEVIRTASLKSGGGGKGTPAIFGTTKRNEFSTIAQSRFAPVVLDGPGTFAPSAPH